MFSTSPTRPTASTFALRPASAAISPTTAPAPAMSHFMSSMPPAGLMLMPPVSKVTPLPMKASGLAPAPSCRPAAPTRRATASPPCAARWRCPAPRRAARRSPASSISFGPSTSTFRPSVVSFLQRSANSAGFSTLAGSLTRSRREEHALGHRLQRRPRRPCAAGGVGGQHRQLGELRLVLRLLLGAVAVEAIGAQHGAERDVRAACAAVSASAATMAAGSRARRATAAPPASSSASARQLVGLPSPTATHARQAGAGREDGDRSCPCAPLNSAAVERAADRAAGRLVGLLPQARRRLAFVRPAARARRISAGRAWRRRCRAWSESPGISGTPAIAATVAAAGGFAMPARRGLYAPAMTEVLTADPAGIARAAESAARRRAGRVRHRDGLRPGRRRDERAARWPRCSTAKGRPHFNPLICHYPGRRRRVRAGRGRRASRSAWPRRSGRDR